MRSKIEVGDLYFEISGDRDVYITVKVSSDEFADILTIMSDDRSLIMRTNKRSRPHHYNHAVIKRDETFD